MCAGLSCSTFRRVASTCYAEIKQLSLRSGERRRGTGICIWPRTGICATGVASALGPTGRKEAGLTFGSLEDAGVAGYHPGLLSGIAFAGANRRPTPIGHDDGILTAVEIAELDLSGVELAVLSACETGLGEVAGGEGLLGLQRAFQVANARTVLASLWSVNDDATRLLITEFYRNLWEKKLPKGEACGRRQLKMLRGELRPSGSRPDKAARFDTSRSPARLSQPLLLAGFRTVWRLAVRRGKGVIGIPRPHSWIQRERRVTV